MGASTWGETCSKVSENLQNHIQTKIATCHLRLLGHRGLDRARPWTTERIPRAYETRSETFRDTWVQDGEQAWQHGNNAALRALPHASIRSLSSHYTIPKRCGHCASIESLSSHYTQHSVVVVLQLDRCHRMTHDTTTRADAQSPPIRSLSSHDTMIPKHGQTHRAPPYTIRSLCFNSIVVIA